MKINKSFIVGVVLGIVAIGGTLYTGCVTNQETGQKEVDPVAFATIKSVVTSAAYLYVTSEDADPYVSDFEKVVAAIDIFLLEESTPDKILEFVESLKIKEVESGYAKIALQAVADIYVAQYDTKVKENVSKYVKAKELLIAARDGFKNGLADRG